MDYTTKRSVAAQLFHDFAARMKRLFSKTYLLPWLKTKELDIIIEVLHNLKPARCLEWGCGYSTLYFPSQVPDILEWQSIEHNEEWYHTINEKVDDPRINVSLVKPNNAKIRRGDGDYKGFQRYVDFPKTFDTTWDYVFIDGRARVACLRVAYELVSEDGIVIVHDANREEYVEDTPDFQYSELFTDYRAKRGGVWIGSKTKDINNVLDVEKHKQKWEVHDQIAKLLFLK